MKKVTCIICLLTLISSCGCAGRVENLPLLPNEVGMLPLVVPNIYLVMKNVNEVNAMMEAEDKAIAENAQKKNPIYFIKKEK